MLKSALYVCIEKLGYLLVVSYKSKFVLVLKTAEIEIGRGDGKNLPVNHKAFGVEVAGCVEFYLYTALIQRAEGMATHYVGGLHVGMQWRYYHHLNILPIN